MTDKKKKQDKSKDETKSRIKTVQNLTDRLLSLIGSKAKGEVSFDEENKTFNIDIKTEEEAGLLIGKKGETINSIQMFLSLALRQKVGEWFRVLVNVADWREKQQERLEQIAIQTAERARETGEPQSLYNLSPAERRIIHLFLSKEIDIKTESVGEGEGRYLIVSIVK